MSTSIARSGLDALERPSLRGLALSTRARSWAIWAILESFTILGRLIAAGRRSFLRNDQTRALLHPVSGSDQLVRDIEGNVSVDLNRDGTADFDLGDPDEPPR